MDLEMSQISGKIGGCGVAFTRFFRQTTFDDPGEGCRCVWPQVRKRSGFVPQDRRQDLGNGLFVERRDAGEHLVEQKTDSELVGVLVYRPTCGLLRRHVGGGSDDPTRAGLGLDLALIFVPGRQQLGETESRILTKPSRESMTFDGLRSLWTTPAR